MTQQEFLNELADMLEIDVTELEPSLELERMMDWDSLASVSFIALADSKLNKSVPPADLEACKTVQDLIDLVADKLD